MENEKPRKTSPSKTARRAARILKMLGEHGIPLGISELSKKSGISLASCYRILTALEIEGLVYQDPATHKYGISIGLFALGRVAVHHMGFGERVQNELRALSKRVGETVNMGVIRQGRIIYLHNIESDKALKTGIKVGSERPAHATAIGKVILAFSNQEDLDYYIQNTSLEAYTPSSITDVETLCQRLRKVKEQGFTIDREECHLGVTAIGAPIRDFYGRVIAGLAVTGPSSRFSENLIKKILEDITSTAQKISQLQGYYVDEMNKLESVLEPEYLDR
jgi:IclR family KDG regulon transcriptional repressor